MHIPRLDFAHPSTHLASVIIFRFLSIRFFSSEDHSTGYHYTSQHQQCIYALTRRLTMGSLRYAEYSQISTSISFFLSFLSSRWRSGFRLQMQIRIQRRSLRASYAARLLNTSLPKWGHVHPNAL